MIRTVFMATASTMLMVGGAMAAPVTIDSFSTTAFQVVGAPSLVGDVNPSSVGGSTSDAIGGFRRITNTRTAPVGGASFGKQVQTVITGGIAAISLGAGVDGTVLFEWDGGGGGLGGADLIDGTNVSVDISVLSSDIGGVVFTLGLDGDTITKTTVGSGPQTLSFNFSDFAVEDGTDVDAISLLITGPTAFDATFDFLGAVPPSNVGQVPLPATGMMILGGLAAMGAARARRR